VDVILKGNISTPILNRAMLRIVVRNTISLVTLFDAACIAGGRPMLLTDPGVTTVCSFGRMVGLIENAVDVGRAILGLERPRVAVLSANEKVIDSLPSTRLAAALAERKWDNAVVYGPLSFDLAVDPESVGLKGLPETEAAREVAGQADILVCPNLEAANILYKVIMEAVKYGLGTFAGITVGVTVPYVILSRADNVETKLQSIALCSLACEFMEMGKPRERSRPAFFPVLHRTFRVLVINPGATATRVALFENERCAASAAWPHEPLRFEEKVREFLGEHQVGSLDAEEKLPGGTYLVDEAMVAAIERAEFDHPSNLAIPLAAKLARELGVQAFVVDPVVADEFCEEAEFSGYAPVRRRSVAHMLSVRAAAHEMAAKTGTPIEQTNYVVAHLGSGITVAAVRGGRVVDNNIAFLGEGPFSPQRVGTLPLADIIALCYSGRFSREELIEELTTRGGLVSYLGTHDVEAIEARIAEGDQGARRVVEAMCYQIAHSSVASATSCPSSS